MGFVVRKLDPASCNHLATGSTNVLVNSRGATRVGKDIAGGVILGPGEITVLVNGFPISLLGDAVARHGDDEHEAAVMVGASTNVLAG